MAAPAVGSQIVVIIDQDSLLLRDRLAVAAAARKAERAHQIAFVAREIWGETRKIQKQAVDNANHLAEMAEKEEQLAKTEYKAIFKEMESLHGPSHFEEWPEVRWDQ